MPTIASYGIKLSVWISTFFKASNSSSAQYIAFSSTANGYDEEGCSKETKARTSNAKIDDEQKRGRSGAVFVNYIFNRGQLLENFGGNVVGTDVGCKIRKMSGEKEHTCMNQYIHQIHRASSRRHTIMRREMVSVQAERTNPKFVHVVNVAVRVENRIAIL